MVNIVNFALAVAQLNHVLNHAQNIVLAQNVAGIRSFRKRNIQRRIHLHATDRRQVVSFFIKEQHLENRFRRFQRNRFARAHNLKDVAQSFFAVGIAVSFQGIADIRPDIDVVDIEQIQFFDFCFVNCSQQLFVQLGARVGDNFAGLGDNQSLRQEFAVQVVVVNQKALQPFVNQPLCRTHRQLLVFFPDNLIGVGVNQIKREFDALDPCRFKRDFPVFFELFDMVDVIEVGKDFLFAHARNFRRVNALALLFQLGDFFFGFLRIQGIENRCNRQLSAAVNTRVNQIFGVEFKI